MSHNKVEVGLVIAAVVLLAGIVFLTDFTMKPIVAFPLFYWLLLVAAFAMAAIGTAIRIIQAKLSVGHGLATLVLAAILLLVLLGYLTHESGMGSTLLFALIFAFAASTGLAIIVRAVVARN